MKVKVSDAQGNTLNWLVAACEDKHPSLFILKQTGELAKEHHYSTDWSKGGPIIDRESIGWFDARKEKGYCQAAKPGAEFVQRGPTPLIAAMRCYVVSKLGEEVEVPENLV